MEDQVVHPKKFSYKNISEHSYMYTKQFASSMRFTKFIPLD